jgi:hypothetical protein
MTSHTLIVCKGVNADGSECAKAEECAHFSAFGIDHKTLNLCEQIGEPMHFFKPWRDMVREGGFLSIKFIQATPQMELLP